MQRVSQRVFFPRSQYRSLTGRAREFWHEGRRPIMPLMGYPGLNYTGSTVKQNQFNHAAQYKTISRLYDRFRPDAMMFLMDLSVEASALGLPVRFPLDETPTVECRSLESADCLQTYRNIDVLADARVMVYLEVIRHMRAGLPVPVGGYVTGPFTLAGLIMDANDLAMKTMLDPDLCHDVLEFATGVVVRYTEGLRDAGADFVMILDPTAVMLGPSQFSEFAGAYVRELTGLVNDVEVILHICGNTSHILDDMAHTGVVGLSLDSDMDFAEAARVVGPDMLLIGNVSPVEMLLNSPEAITAQTNAVLGATADHPPFLLSTGCDLPQDVPMRNIRALMDAGREWRRAQEPAAIAPIG